MRRAISATLDGFAFFWCLGVGPICWILRDGLGPGAVDSHGAHAVGRFLLTFYWGPVLAAILALRLLVRRRSTGLASDAAEGRGGTL